MKPLCIDIYCGLGGWSEGFLTEGYECIGFDIERHDYGAGGYPGQLVLQDALTLHGSQFRNAAVIVASPPCQAYSYMAMPWSRAKKMAAEYWDGTRDVADLTALFDACFRIQREACEAAGRHIPLVVENVKGAQPWVGRAKWHYGSFYLWGDVPTLMPIAMPGVMKLGVAHRSNGETNFHGSAARARSGSKNAATAGGSWFNVAHGKVIPGNTVGAPQRGDGLRSFQSAAVEGVKNGNDWFGSGADCSQQRRASSKSPARKAASAQIAKIPFELARYIARTFKPVECVA